MAKEKFEIMPKKDSIKEKDIECCFFRIFSDYLIVQPVFKNGNKFWKVIPSKFDMSVERLEDVRRQT